MARKLTKPRPAQGARLAALRKVAGLSQTEFAGLIGERQQNIAFWEQSEKPPRSDVLLPMAEVLGVRVEDILSRKKLKKTRSGPVGKVRRAFDDVSKLPRRQQDKILEFLDALVNQYKSKTQAG